MKIGRMMLSHQALCTAATAPCLGSLLRGIRTWHCAAWFSPCHRHVKLRIISLSTYFSLLPCGEGAGKQRGWLQIQAGNFPPWILSSRLKTLERWMASIHWERDAGHCWCSGHLGTKYRSRQDYPCTVTSPQTQILKTSKVRALAAFWE